jgi:hypothetical protein
MSCDEIQSLLSADLDGQLDDESRPVLDAHLATCADCRAARESLAALDAALVRGLRPMRARADDVAERTIARLRTQTQPAPRAPSRRWIGYLVAVAGGYVLAVFLSRPLPPSGVPIPDKVVQHPGPEVPEKTALPPVVATIVAFTGPVEVRRPRETDWVSVEIPSFSCPTDTSIRTPESSLCELETDRGCRIRMDAGTEVDLKSGSELHIAGGQLWCQAPETSQMKIVAKGSSTPHPTSTSASCTVTWSGPGSLMTACSAEQPLTIAAGSGAIEIVTATETRQLHAGDSAQVIGDDVEPANGSFEPLLDASWMHPLLIQKGFADSELNERVNGLLAQLGRAKMSFLFERDIRGLGEYSALPLLRFVESTLSEEEVGRRQQAASILADVAPAWMVPDLIALLGDTDPVVRVASARALTRLTGQTQGISPEQWRESGDVWGSAHERWLAWWTENRRVYATRPAGVTQTRLPALAPEQMLKARQ